MIACAPLVLWNAMDAPATRHHCVRRAVMATFWWTWGITEEILETCDVFHLNIVRSRTGLSGASVPYRVVVAGFPGAEP